MNDQSEITGQPKPSAWEERDHFPEPRTIPAGWDLSELKNDSIPDPELEASVLLELKKDHLV